MVARSTETAMVASREITHGQKTKKDKKKEGKVEREKGKDDGKHRASCMYVLLSMSAKVP